MAKTPPKDGKPVVAFHGSTKDFKSFKTPKKKNHNLNYGPGVYFASDPAEASDYAIPQIHRHNADAKAFSDIQSDPANRKAKKDLARKHGMKSTVDTRHKNWDKFATESLELDHAAVAKKLGLSPNVRKVKLGVSNGFDPYSYEHAQKVAASIGHAYDPQGHLANHNQGENKFETNHYDTMQEESLGWNQAKKHSDFYGPKADFNERTTKLNSAIQAAGFDHIHDKQHGHYVVFNPKHVKDYFRKSETDDLEIDAYDLEKGTKGNWKSEGYKIEITHPGNEPMISASHPSYGEVGYLYVDDKGANLKAAPITVKADHQRKGLATEMYRMAEAHTGKKFKPAEHQLEGGKALWNQKDRPFGKSELEKGWKEAVAGVAMASSIASASISKESATPRPTQPKIELRSELKRIAMNESSGGKNKNHEMTHVGLNAGQTAAGSTGIMPITVRETVSRNPELKAKYGSLLAMHPSEVTKHLNDHPDVEADISNHHWARLDHVFGKDDSRKAFAWRNGITAAKQATDSEVSSHPYVQKFNAMKKSEELAKMPKVTNDDPSDSADWAMDRLQDAHMTANMKSGVKHISSEPMGEGLHHHHFSEGAHHYHTASTSSDFKDFPVARVSGHKEGSRLQVTFSAVDPEFQGKGLGTKMHELAAKAHGGIFSDAYITKPEQGVFKKLAANPKFTTKLEGGSSKKFHSVDVKKSDDLDKGSMQRLAPFKPETDSGSQQKMIHTWQGGGPKSLDSRNHIQKETGPIRTRFLHKLAAATQSRPAKEGGREFLLHRGMSANQEEEAGVFKETPTHVEHSENSSWTPKHNTASAFATNSAYNGKPKQVQSAWIHEDKILTVPKQHGNAVAGTKDRGSNGYVDEHEVIVGPHHSEKAAYKASNFTEPKENLNERITQRGQKGYAHFQTPSMIRDARKSESGEGLVSLLTKIEDLAKMSQPRVTLPGLPKVTSRPDQEVKVVTKPRDGKIAVKAKQAVEGKAGKEQDGRTRNYAPSNSNSAQKLNTEGTTKLGFMSDYKHAGPMAVAHNPGSEHHKVKRHVERFLDRMQRKGGQELKEKAAKHLGSKFDQPTAAVLSDTAHTISEMSHVPHPKSLSEDVIDTAILGREAHKESVTSAKKKANRTNKHNDHYGFEAQGKVSATSVEPKLANPAYKKKIKGIDTGLKAINSAVAPDNTTVEHEGLHLMMAQVEHQHGKEFKDQLNQHLISKLHPEDVAGLREHMATRGYKQNSMKTEEVLTHARDLLVDEDRRKQFSNWVNAGKKNNGSVIAGGSLYGGKSYTTGAMEKLDMNRLKSGWKNVVTAAKAVKPDTFKKSEFAKSAGDVLEEIPHEQALAMHKKQWLSGKHSEWGDGEGDHFFPFSKKHDGQPFVRVRIPTTDIDAEVAGESRVHKYKKTLKEQGSGTMGPAWVTAGMTHNDGSIHRASEHATNWTALDGNHRVKAAQELGHETHEVIMPKAHWEAYNKGQIVRKSESARAGFSMDSHDFKSKKSKHGEYTISNNQPDHNGVFEVTATHKGKQIGQALLRHTGSHVKAIDEREARQFDLDRGTAVDGAHQRKGVATAMYNHAEKVTGLKVRPAADQTKDAKSFWANRSQAVNKAESAGAPTSFEAEKKKAETAKMWKQINKYHPDKPKKSEPVKKSDPFSKWQKLGGGHDSAAWAARDSIPRMEGKERSDALNSLRTSGTRLHPETKERMILLHRGMSGKEHKLSVSGANVNHKHSTSWTPNFKAAASFSQHLDDPGHIVSAWIPESKIRTFPGHKSKKFRDEQEVIVEPDHNSEIHASKTSSQFWKENPNFGKSNSSNHSQLPACDHCGLDKWDHKADTQNCPSGKKTRIGFLAFSESTFSKSEAALAIESIDGVKPKDPKALLKELRNRVTDRMSKVKKP